MVTAESKIDLPPKDSIKYILDNNPSMVLKYDERKVPQVEYDKLFGGNER